MARKRFIATALLLFLLSALASPVATAQSVPECPRDFVEGVDPTPEPAPDSGADLDSSGSTNVNCADALVYPGPFDTAPTVPASPYSAPAILFEPADDTAPLNQAESTDPALAHSGSEAIILAYFGTGLFAFGAVALGARRSFLPEASEQRR